MTEYKDHMVELVAAIEGGLLAHPTRHSIRQLTEMGDTASVIRAVDLLAAIDAHCAGREPEEPSPGCDHKWSRVLDMHDRWKGIFRCDMCGKVKGTSHLAPANLTPEEAAELEAEQGEPSEPTVQAAQDAEGARFLRHVNRHMSGFTDQERRHLQDIADRLDGGAS